MTMTDSKKPSPLESLLKKSDDCKRPACEETITALSDALQRVNRKDNNDASTGGYDYSTCPPNKESIGSGSWRLLHTMAAWYPEKPSPDEEIRMKQFIEALSLFYPCTYCATDFQENIKKSPVQTSSRKDLSIWLCEQHNIVNKKLSKPIFQCDMNILDQRWRKSNDPRCG